MDKLKSAKASCTAIGYIQNSQDWVPTCPLYYRFAHQVALSVPNFHSFKGPLLVRDRLSFRSRCIYPKPITYAAFQPRPFRGRRPFERENLWKLSTFQQK